MEGPSKMNFKEREYWVQYEDVLISSKGNIIRRIPRRMFEKIVPIKFDWLKVGGKNHRTKSLLAQLFLGVPPGGHTSWVDGHEGFKVEDIEAAPLRVTGSVEQKTPTER